MKVLKKIIFIVVLVSISIGLLFVGSGYDMYKKAIEEKEEKIKLQRLKVKRIIQKFQSYHKCIKMQ